MLQQPSIIQSQDCSSGFKTQTVSFSTTQGITLQSNIKNMVHKLWHIVLQIPQKLCGYLVWTLQFCWLCLFDQFSLCIPLFHVIGSVPGGVSTRAAALISTWHDWHLIWGLFSSFLVLFCYSSSCPVHSESFDYSGFPLSLPQSPSAFHSIFIFLSPALFLLFCLSLPGVFN